MGTSWSNTPEGNLAGTASASSMNSPGLGHPPRPGQDVYLVLVLVVSGLSLDAVNFDKHVQSHLHLLPM